MKILNQVRNQDGTYGQKIGWNDIGACVLLVIVIVGTLVSVAHAKGENATNLRVGGSTGNLNQMEGKEHLLTKNNDYDGSSCIEISSGTHSYVCSDKETLAKWTAFLEEEIEDLKVEAGKPRAILMKVCRDHGFNDSKCPSILYGMAMTESRMKSNAVGDSGKSIGWFQIHLGYHPDIKKSCATDLRCAANWTLTRMIAYGFVQNQNVAIQRHNGTPNTPATKKYLASVLAFARGF